MRRALVLFLVVATFTPSCDAPTSVGIDGKRIFRQRAVADIACGPSAIFNWMSHGGSDPQGILAALSEKRTPVETVRHIIDTYGMRRSATNPSVTRYGPHNGGVGSVNLMLMATELLGDHLESPPELRGEYLHRMEDEPTAEHLARIADWFSQSIESGVPILFYIRGYRRTSARTAPGTVFGHHVVITSLDTVPGATGGDAERIGFTFVDSSSGRVDRGELRVAEREFTAPTFTYRFEGERAVTDERVRTGRPVLEVRIRSYESAYPPDETIMLAHFATFAGAGGSGSLSSISAPGDGG